MFCGNIVHLRALVLAQELSQGEELSINYLQQYCVSRLSRRWCISLTEKLQSRPMTLMRQHTQRSVNHGFVSEKEKYSPSALHIIGAI